MGCKILESSLADPAGGFGEAEEIVPSQALSSVIAQVGKSVGNDVTIVSSFSDEGGVISVNREEFDSVFTSLLTNAGTGHETWRRDHGGAFDPHI